MAVQKVAIGNVRIHGETIASQRTGPLIPGVPIDLERLTVTNTGQNDAFVRVRVMPSGLGSALDQGLVSLYSSGNDWKYRDGFYYYKHALAPQEEAAALTTCLLLDPQVDGEATGKKIKVRHWVEAIPPDRVDGNMDDGYPHWPEVEGQP